MSSGPSRPEGESALALVDLHRRDAKVEHDAVGLVMAQAMRDRFKIGKPILDQDEPAAGGVHQVGSERDGALVSINPDDLAIRRRKNCARIAAGAEGRIDVDAVVSRIKKLDRGTAEHGNVTSQSASDSRGAAAARHHSRAPGGPSAALRDPSCFLCARTFSVASASSARKRPGSQI